MEIYQEEGRAKQSRDAVAPSKNKRANQSNSGWYCHRARLDVATVTFVSCFILFYLRTISVLGDKVQTGSERRLKNADSPFARPSLQRSS